MTAEPWRPEAEDVEILGLLAQGLTAEGAARRVGLSDRTVRRRLRAMADDLGVDTTIEIVVHAVRAGVL